MSAHVVSIRAYILTFAVLMILLAATVGADLLDLGTFNAVIAFAVAAIKAALVAMFFMHVRFSNRLIWLFAGAGVFWLAIMVTLTMNDYLTRA